MSAGMDPHAQPVLDRNDPNYESDGENGLLRSPSMQSQLVKRYKETVSLLPCKLLASMPCAFWLLRPS